MAVRNSRTKRGATMKATMARKRGLQATVFKKKRGYGTSITRKK